MFKITEKKAIVQSPDDFYKSYMKPIGLKFDETYDNIKSCKSAYKKHYKQIGIIAPIHEKENWSFDDSCHLIQLCQLDKLPENIAEFQIIAGISVVYQFTRFKLKEKTEIQKLSSKFDELFEQ